MLRITEYSENRTKGLLNAKIAGCLDEVARLLSVQQANPYRVQAYRQAAAMVRSLDRPVLEIIDREGLEGLRRLPGIGETLARAIRDLALTGRLPMLDRLRGESDPAALLASVPGIGRKLAHRLHTELGIESLEELEVAAHDGRLSQIDGIGEKRAAGIIESLSTRLGRLRQRTRAQTPPEPSVAQLVDVDREYRTKAQAGTLSLIAPRRFNPKRERWLPVLHTRRGERHYTALFSNTARAHEMGKTRDWVVLYYDGEGGERQCTVITSERGQLKGKRIVRGREIECARYYAVQENRSNAGEARDPPTQNKPSGSGWSYPPPRRARLRRA